MAPVMIVTGGSQGIGAAVARMAGARGYAVALTYQSNRLWPTPWSKTSPPAADARSPCRRRWPTRPRSWHCSAP